KDQAEDHLTITPTTYNTLKQLKKKGITIICISTSPKNKKEAQRLLKRKIKLFKLDKFIDESYPAQTYQQSKPEIIMKILKNKGISKKEALMVGDTYSWDYKPMMDHNIDALLIDSKYKKHPLNKKIRQRTIKNLKDLLKYI
ncbi:MAG: HAD hydrolase-like protein, partial [Nanoarchaeota archaeon]|nr:HAD hydrolase-like protein [Nanoarchaeota archaeon]